MYNSHDSDDGAVPAIEIALGDHERLARTAARGNTILATNPTRRGFSPVTEFRARTQRRSPPRRPGSAMAVRERRRDPWRAVVADVGSPRHTFSVARVVAMRATYLQAGAANGATPFRLPHVPVRLTTATPRAGAARAPPRARGTATAAPQCTAASTRAKPARRAPAGQPSARTTRGSARTNRVAASRCGAPPRKARHCARRKTPLCRQIRASHSASRFVQPSASSAAARPLRCGITALPAGHDPVTLEERDHDPHRVADHQFGRDVGQEREAHRDRPGLARHLLAVADAHQVERRRRAVRLRRLRQDAQATSSTCNSSSRSPTAVAATSSACSASVAASTRGRPPQPQDQDHRRQRPGHDAQISADSRAAITPSRSLPRRATAAVWTARVDAPSRRYRRPRRASASARRPLASPDRSSSWPATAARRS